MKISEMIAALQRIKDKNGDLECLLTTRYDHYSIRWIDHMEALEHFREHVCIRLDDYKDK